MDFWMDLLAEAFFEFFGEGFLSLTSAFLPEKSLSQKGRKVVSGIFFALAALLFFGLFIGIALLWETGWKSAWGWILVVLALVYTVVGIVMKILTHRRKNGK